MNALISAFWQLTDVWCENLWRASWQGAIALAAAWAIGRWCMFLSPRVVCWIWRFACLKLLIGLVAIQPVELALLSARAEAPAVPQTISYNVTTDWAETYPAAQQQVSQPAERLPVSSIAAALLLSVWLVGFFYCLRRTARQRKSIHRLLASSDLCTAERSTLILAEEAGRLGVRRLPALRSSRQTDSPLLLGIWRPTIILPAGVEEKFDESELRLMIAHELAHLRRQDLHWNWLPTVATWLFFFHPLVWLMTRCWLEAQEAACDELVIQRRAAQRADYGRLLVKLATLAPAETNLAPTAAGVLGAYRNLERRILAMARVKPFSPRRLAVAAAMLVIVAIFTIVPWRLVAQEPKAEKAPQVAVGYLTVARTDETSQLADPVANRALQRLRELGAMPAGFQGDEGLSVGIGRGWKGKAADLGLLADLTDLGRLMLDLDFIGPEAVSTIKLASPVKVLVLGGLSDKWLEGLTHLPECVRLIVPQDKLTAKGWSRLAQLATGVQFLEFIAPGIDDEALRAIARFPSLKGLQLIQATITDDSLLLLTTLRTLEELKLFSCGGVRGPGYANLAPIRSLRRLVIYDVPIDAASLRALSKLTQLAELDLRGDVLPPEKGNLKPADVAVLKALTNLKALDFGSTNSSEGMAAEFGLPVLEAASQLPALRRLTLRSIATDDEALEILAKMPHLEQLSLPNIAPSDRSLDALAALRELKDLELTVWGQIGEPQAAKLAKLQPLTQLDLVGSQLDDAGLAKLTALPGLETLVVSGSQITGAGLKSAANLKHLKMLSLDDSPFNDEACEALRNLPGLESLDLSETKITDRALEAIAALPNLQSLALNRTAVTAEGLLKLRDLKKLSMLSVEGIKMTDDQTARFSEAMPHVYIQRPDFLAMNPGDSLVMATTATSLGGRGRLGDAFDLLEKAHEKDPTSVEVYKAAVQVLRQNFNQATDAQKKLLDQWLTAAIQQAPDSLELRLLLVDLRDVEGRFDESAKLYRALLARTGLPKRERAIVQNNLAYILVTRGSEQDLAEAQQLSDAAVAYFGPIGSVLDTRGLIYLARGDAKSAVADFTAAVANLPSATNYFHLALAQDKAGNAAAAAEAFATAEKLQLDVKSLSPGERKGYDRLKKSAAEPGE